MIKVKKIFFVFVLTFFAFLLVACKGADTTKVSQKISEARNLVKNTLPTTKEKNEISVLDSNKYVKKAHYDEFIKYLDDLEAQIKNKNIKQEKVDELLKELENKYLDFVSSKIFYGTFSKNYSNNKEGLLEAIKDLKEMLSKLNVVNNDTEASAGATYILKKDKEAFDKELKEEVEDKITPTMNESQYEELINKVDEILKNVKNKFKIGQKGSSLETIEDKFEGDIKKLLNGNDNERLNLHGKEVTFYTHVLNEESPFEPGYKSDVLKTEEYKAFLKGLEEKYNFKFKFATPKGDYFEIAKNLATELAATNDAKIIRVAEKSALLEHIKLGNLAPIDSLLNKLGSEYLFNNWQRERGKVFGKTFGIQRFEGVTYPDMMVFNRKILTDAGIKPEEMPDKLWASGKWDLEKFAEYLRKIKGQDGITPAGLSPTCFGVQSVLANVLKLIDQNKNKIEDQLNLDNGQVTNILSAYKELVDEGLLTYKADDDLANTNFIQDKLMNVNHMRDSFNGGKLGFTMVQNWSMPFDKVADYGIVPIPQVDKQENKKYITPIEAGDVLTVSKGNNHQQVSLIMMLINKYVKEKTEEFYKEKAKEYGITGDLSDEKVFNKLLIEIWISKKLSFVDGPDKEAQKELARRICAFMHGYKTEKYFNDENNEDNDHTGLSNVIPSELDQVGATNLYALAIQKAFKNKDSSFLTKIQAEKPNIIKNYEEVLDQVRRFIIK